MTIFESIILGFVQGVAEFLPISSSGHLVIVQKLLNFSEPPIFLDVILHSATLLAVLIYFKDSLAKYLTRRKFINIITGSIPAFIFGIFLSSYLDIIFNSLYIVGVGLIITGTIMFLTKKIVTGDSILTPKKAFFIGLFQATALFPGISRSGSTIFGGLVNKLTRKEAFEFSFILSIPAIVGALLLQIFSIQTPQLSIEIFTGFITAFLSGLISIKMLDILVNNEKLYLFGYYCFTIGTALLVIGL